MKKVFFRKTRRLIIRPLKKKDYDAWFSAHSSMLPKQNIWDAENKNFDQLSPKDFSKLLKDQKQKRAKEEFCDYGVFLKSGELIGQISLMNFVRSVTQSSFLGYRIYNQYWKMGYAGEAIKAAADIAFKDHKLHRIVAGIEPKNKRSIAVVKKIGFRNEGLSKRVVLLRGEWQDLHQYALTTEDCGVHWKGTANIRRK